LTTIQANSTIIKPANQEQSDSLQKVKSIQLQELMIPNENRIKSNAKPTFSTKEVKKDPIILSQKPIDRSKLKRANNYSSGKIKLIH